jgi:hypothetical protein
MEGQLEGLAASQVSQSNTDADDTRTATARIVDHYESIRRL